MVAKELNLVSGCLDVGNFSLSLEDGATLTSTGMSRFIKVSGMGSFSVPIAMGASFTFGVGLNSFTPVTIKNNGDTDIFQVSLIDKALANGTTGAAFTSNVVNRTWLIDKKDPNNANVDLTMRWNASDEAPGFDRTAAYISHFTNGAWDPGVAGMAMGSDPYTLTRTGITSFSPFGVGSNNALPVELLHFEATVTEAGNLLIWETATEQNNAGFEVQRSQDGQMWQSLAFVKGFGTTVEPQLYKWLDNEPLQGINYYRLKQLDFDGAYEYSTIVFVAYTSKLELAQLKVYSNPLSDVLNYEVADLTAVQSVQLYDAAGKLIKTATQINGQLSLADLNAGTYFLVIETSSKRLQTEVVKE